MTNWSVGEMTMLFCKKGDLDIPLYHFKENAHALLRLGGGEQVSVQAS